MINFTDREKYPIFTKTYCFAVSKYSTDINYYHTIHHIYNMLKLASKDEEYIRSIIDVDCFITAILFHDVVYVTGRQENEADSAKMFEKVYDACFKNDETYSEDKKHLICNFILSTKYGYKHITQSEKLLHDYDYIGFADKYDMLLADKQILNECLRDRFSFAISVSGRLDFYKTLYDNISQSGQLFLTDKYSKFNEVALNNIKEHIGLN